MSLRSARLRSRALFTAGMAAALLVCPSAVFAADQHAGEVVARDAYSTTTKEGDVFRTRAFPEPVNFKADDGSWKPIDRSLVRESDGTVHPAAVDGDAAIPSSIARPVVIEHDGRRLSFDLRGASGGREIAGTKATFDDALAGVDISYKARGNGLKETLTLASPGAQRTFTYDVTGDADLDAAVAPDGQLVFTDAADKERFRVAAPLAWDSAEPKAYANALELSVSKVEAGRWTVTLKADDEWLDDPSRVYPVTLDPDYYWVDLALRFHGANQDCYLASNDFANYSYCSGNLVQVGYYNRSFRGMFKFDVASAIPKYATATKATFLLWQPQSTPKGPANMRLRTVTRDWDNTATWNQSKKNVQNWTTAGGDVSTDPNLVGPPTTVGAQNYWYYWDAPLAAVNGWIKGTLPNHGLQLSTDPGSPPTTAYGFTSTDGDQALWPALDVTWKPDTSAPTGVVPAMGKPGARDQSLLGGSYTGTITASAQDEASGVKKLELLRDNDLVVSTAAISCPNDLCPLNASADLSLNTTTWSEGRHTFKLRATDGAGNVTTTSAWNVYVDRTAPAFPADAVAGIRPGDAGSSRVDWTDASDPALADGSGPFAVRTYAVRYLSGGTWSAWKTVGDNGTEIPGTPSSLQLELVAKDDVGNSSPVRALTAAGLPSDPDDDIDLDIDSAEMPTPGEYDGGDGDPDPDLDDVGLDEDTPVSALSAAAADEPEQGTDGRPYRCKGTWAPIQAQFSGFVTGNCKGNTEVRGVYTQVDQDRSKDPGAANEGRAWEIVKFPSSVHYVGCGWMNYKNRIEPILQGGPTGNCNATPPTHPVASHVKRFKGSSLYGVRQPTSKKYAGLYVWSNYSVIRDKDYESPSNPNGYIYLPDGSKKKREVGGIKYKPNWGNPNKSCTAYANIVPWKKDQQVRRDEIMWRVHDGSTNLRIRYIARYRVKDEAGVLRWYVNVKSDYEGDKDKAWGFIEANCLFKKT